MTTTPRVVVLVTVGCHLCEAACSVVADVCTGCGIEWTARDLAEATQAEQARWRDFVPVVLVDGAVHDVLRVSADRLGAALTA